MMIGSEKAEEQALMNAAYAACAAARTAPKARGIDHTDTLILTGEDKARLAAEMRKAGEALGEQGAKVLRDASNVEASQAVVLVGAKNETRGLNERCQLCGFSNCTACKDAGANCVFTGIDLGIALGSAASLVTDSRVDTRIMYTIGVAAASLGLMGDHKIIMGMPLSVSGKSPYFDRKA